MEVKNTPWSNTRQPARQGLTLRRRTGVLGAPVAPAAAIGVLIAAGKLESHFASCHSKNPQARVAHVQNFRPLFRLAGLVVVFPIDALPQRHMGPAAAMCVSRCPSHLNLQHCGW